MPFALWHSLVEGVQAALETKTAIEQAQRTDRGRPFAIAGSGLVMCFALGAFLQSTTVMAAATIPPALVAWWGGLKAWGTREDRRPALAAGLVCLGSSGFLYFVSVVTPPPVIPLALALKLFGCVLGSLALGVGLVLWGWFRDEWHEI